MADFPPGNLKEDSQYHSMTYEDRTLRHPTEGGNLITRPRTTARPARIWTTGFSHIFNDQREALEAFYESVAYGASSFTYDLPYTEVGGPIVTVAVKVIAPFTFTYVGLAEQRIWNVTDIQLREEV